MTVSLYASRSTVDIGDNLPVLKVLYFGAIAFSSLVLPLGVASNQVFSHIKLAGYSRKKASLQQGSTNNRCGLNSCVSSSKVCNSSIHVVENQAHGMMFPSVVFKGSRSFVQHYGCGG